MDTRLQGKRDNRIIAVPSQQQKGVVRVCDVINIDQRYAAFLQTVIDGMKWQFVSGKGNGPLPMLHMGETFFFNRREYPSIFDKTGGRVVIDGVDSKCIHLFSFGISILKESYVWWIKKLQLRCRLSLPGLSDFCLRGR